MDEEIYGVSEGEEEVEIAEPLEDESLGEEEQEVAEPVEERSDADRAFAEMRRSNEDLARRLAEAEARADEYDKALGLFFDGDDKALQAEAYVSQRPLEEVRAEQAQNSRYAQIEAENQQLRTKLVEQEAQSMMDNDLAEIQKIDPNVKSLGELGKVFTKFRLDLNMSASEAYMATKAYEESTKAKAPKPIGKVNVGSGAKSNFLSREEVLNMTPEEQKANYDIIRKSMTKW